MSKLKSSILATVLIVALIAGAAVPAAANHDTDEDESFFDSLRTDDGGVLSSIAADVAEETAGFASEASKSIAGLTAEETNASDDLEAFADVYNSNSGVIEDHANERLPADSNHTTFRLTCEDQAGETATMYLLADYNSSTGEYENSRIVNKSTFNDTNRTEDAYVEGDWYVCQNAAGELQTYVDEYAEPGKDLSNTYYASMMRKYASSVESDLWEDDDAE